MPDAVLFDFNGVLVDDEHLHLAAFNDVLAPHGVAMSDSAYAERYLGFDDRGAFTAVLRDHGRDVPDALVARLIARKAEVYAHRATTELRIFPRAADIVRATAATTRVAVVSGALRSEIDSALRVMGVEALFELIVAAEDVDACKPDPAGYLRAIERLGVRHDRTVAIEDSVAGIESARAAGLAVVAVAHTYDRATLAAAGARAVFDAIADVTPAALDGVLR